MKYFTGSADKGFVGMNDVEYLVYSTAGANALCIGVVLALGWHRRAQFESWRSLTSILLSGVCTAFIIPSTTLLYAQPFSVMIAMVIMRAGVLIVSRLVDQILIWQRLSGKKVLWQENAAVALALLALSTQAGYSLLEGKAGTEKHFAFLQSPFVMGLLFFYLLSYFARLYIMNFFKATDPTGARVDNKAYFGMEQIAASITMLLACAILYVLVGEVGTFSGKFVAALQTPAPRWPEASFSGLAYGVVAFFSVFIFLIRDRSATFAGLANRLSSLLAGTVATLLGVCLFGAPMPSWIDWISLSLILAAVGMLTSAEFCYKAGSARKRTR